jgi:hypothetical protein
VQSRVDSWPPAWPGRSSKVTGRKWSLTRWSRPDARSSQHVINCPQPALRYWSRDIWPATRPMRQTHNLAEMALGNGTDAWARTTSPIPNMILLHGAPQSSDSDIFVALKVFSCWHLIKPPCAIRLPVNADNRWPTRYIFGYNRSGQDHDWI